MDLQKSNDVAWAGGLIMDYCTGTDGWVQGMSLNPGNSQMAVEIVRTNWTRDFPSPTREAETNQTSDTASTTCTGSTSSIEPPSTTMTTQEVDTTSTTDSEEDR